MKAEFYKIKDETEPKEIAKGTQIKSTRMKKSLKLMNFILLLGLILLMVALILSTLLLRFYSLKDDAFEDDYDVKKVNVHLKPERKLVVSNIQKVDEVYAVAMDESSKLFFLPASKHSKCHNNTFVLVSKSKCHNNFRKSSLYRITFTVSISMVVMAILCHVWFAISVLYTAYWR